MHIVINRNVFAEQQKTLSNNPVTKDKTILAWGLFFLL